PTGSYTVTIHIPQYLTQRFLGIQTVTQGQRLTLPSISLVTGDMNNDNLLRFVLVDCTMTVGLEPAEQATRALYQVDYSSIVAFCAPIEAKTLVFVGSN